MNDVAFKDKAWIGVDLDGTLALYTEWAPWNVLGAPIAPMVRRVKTWLSQGTTVKIVTARANFEAHEHYCIMTSEKFTSLQMIAIIQDWTEKHIGARLEVTCSKDFNMLELWDDRAVQVVPNTGLRADSCACYPEIDPCEIDP